MQPGNTGRRVLNWKARLCHPFWKIVVLLANGATLSVTRPTATCGEFGPDGELETVVPY